MMKHIWMVMVIFCAMHSGQATAHAMLENTSPANNVVLSTAPKAIHLNFAHPTKLVMLKLQNGQDAIPLKVESGQSAKNFAVVLPALTSGKYLATWSTLSDDGHPMKGSISFTITGK
ncbi:copper resistance CopC family protein [Undibacterium sp. SXout7W]|uniref:copper resistance CopC family protein n=1 Tax=Undibacterium sp. SXout7W TaxID=3413049 RepID=UPI003BF429F7